MAIKIAIIAHSCRGGGGAMNKVKIMRALLTTISIFLFCVSCKAEYKQYLKFYQINYSEPATTESAQGRMLEFTIGQRVGNLPCYAYVHFDSIDGHWRIISKNTAGKMYALNSKDLDNLFSAYGTDASQKYGTSQMFVSGDKIQEMEILKIQAELVSKSPNLFPNGTELNYGVKQDPKWDIILDEHKQAIPDSPLLSYQQGKTIVWPITRDTSAPARLVLNLNCPSVREYCIRRAINILKSNKTNCLFIDNTSWTAFLTNGVKQKYICNDTADRQIILYAKMLEAICREIKMRVTPEPNIIGNGLVEWSLEQKTFLSVFADSPYINGIMCENAFAIKPYCTNIESWLGWITKFRKANKKLLFLADSSVVAKDSKDLNAYKLWLWLHLIADDNVYICIGVPHNYAIYYSGLGSPIDAKPIKEGTVWKRKYQAGQIVFDTSFSTIDNIKLINVPSQ
jgi:hypothetical protein